MTLLRSLLHSLRYRFSAGYRMALAEARLREASPEVFAGKVEGLRR